MWNAVISLTAYMLAASSMALPASGVRCLAHYSNTTDVKMPTFWRWTYCHDQQHVNNCWMLPYSKKSEFCALLQKGEMDAESIAANIKAACIWCDPSEVAAICQIHGIAAASTPGPTGIHMQKSQDCGRKVALALEEGSRGMSRHVLGCHSVAEFFQAASGTVREIFKTRYKKGGEPYTNHHASCNANRENYFSTLCDAYFPTCLSDNPKPGRPNFSFDTTDGDTLSCATARFDISAQPVLKPPREKGLYGTECADAMKEKIEATVDRSTIMGMCSAPITYFNYLVSSKVLTEDGPKFWPEPKQKTCYKNMGNYIHTVCWSYMKVCWNYLLPQEARDLAIL